MKDDIATRVSKGVALLDEHKPEWVGLINLAKLNISSTDRCILGQVYGNFFTGEDVLDMEGMSGAEDHGFDTYSRRYTEARVEFVELNREWKRVIKILRQKQTPIEVEPCTADTVSVA